MTFGSVQISRELLETREPICWHGGSLKVRSLPVFSHPSPLATPSGLSH